MTADVTRLSRCLTAAVLVIGAHAIAPRSASAQLAALVSPGRLSKAHAALEGVDKCLSCHSKGQQVAADKCLTCHKPIAQRIAAKKGVHRDVTNDCVTCHVEHAGVDAELRPFDRTRFDHARDAGFPLDGRHALLAANCASCHKTRSFLTAAPACSSCHADPHKGSLGARCTTCHTTSAKFTEAFKGFDHGKTAFPLAGAHTKVACASCHKTKQFKGTPFASCASCHTDPHRAKFGPTCASCHAETAWRTTKVDHGRTAFPLKGRHATVACQKCHTRPATQVKPRADTCAACHADPHRGTFKQDCASCHNESGFKKGKFDHAATAFPLADKHAGLVCTACHKGAKAGSTDFRGLKTSCESCHADVHRGELGTSCTKCHTSKSFTVASFTHAAVRPFFGGSHATLACAQCHSATLKPARTTADVPALRVGFTTTSTACASCHKDVHLGQMNSGCETCHAVDAPRFAVVGFSHANTKFPLSGKHTAVVCTRCHVVQTGAFPAGQGTARRFKGVAAECVSCHQDPHRGQVEVTCERCHSTTTFDLPGYTHRNARALRGFFVGRHASAMCRDCHAPLPGAPPEAKAWRTYKVSTACTDCHTDVHRGALGADCAFCHKP